MLWRMSLPVNTLDLFCAPAAAMSTPPRTHHPHDPQGNNDVPRANSPHTRQAEKPAHLFGRLLFAPALSLTALGLWCAPSRIVAHADGSSDGKKTRACESRQPSFLHVMFGKDQRRECQKHLEQIVDWRRIGTGWPNACICRARQKSRARPSPLRWRFCQAWCLQSFLRIKVLRPKINSRRVRRPISPIHDGARRPTADLSTGDKSVHMNPKAHR